MIRLNIWILIQAAIIHVEFSHCSCQLQALFKRKDGEYLGNNVIRTEKAASQSTVRCFVQKRCPVYL